jgi:predicted  nucleic acid-binding Zn-ribbon protein
MNATIEALLELQVIDQKRQALRAKRLAKSKVAAKALSSAKAMQDDANAIAAELERLDALIRQYKADAERCDATIEELRAKQMEAKTNKEYMAIINGIEQARLEKNHREQSLNELVSKRDIVAAKADKTQTTASGADQAAAEAAEAAAKAQTPGAEEAELDVIYAAAKAKVDPAFLEAYERLANAGIKSPLMRVDPKTRATPLGAVISMNQLEQIRMGKLVLATGSNQILFVD